MTNFVRGALVCLLFAFPLLVSPAHNANAQSQFFNGTDPCAGKTTAASVFCYRDALTVLGTAAKNEVIGLGFLTDAFVGSTPEITWPPIPLDVCEQQFRDQLPCSDPSNPSCKAQSINEIRKRITSSVSLFRGFRNFHFAAQINGLLTTEELNETFRDVDIALSQLSEAVETLNTIEFFSGGLPGSLNSAAMFDQFCNGTIVPLGDNDMSVEPGEECEDCTLAQLQARTFFLVGNIILNRLIPSLQLQGVDPTSGQCNSPFPGFNQLCIALANERRVILGEISPFVPMLYIPAVPQIELKPVGDRLQALFNIVLPPPNFIILNANATITVGQQSIPGFGDTRCLANDVTFGAALPCFSEDFDAADPLPGGANSINPITFCEILENVFPALICD